MGTDIHYTIERRHPEGGWHCVHSHSMVLSRRIAEEGWGAPLEGPSYDFRRRNYVWFGLLSSLRVNEEGPGIAEDGFPEDATDATMFLMDYDPDRRDGFGDLHSHGHFGLADLKRAFQDREHPAFEAVARYLVADGDEKGAQRVDETMRRYIDALDRLISESGPLGPIRILAKLTYDEHGEIYGTSLSNHERMEIARLEGGWPAPRDEDFRVMIAYDN